MTTFAFGPHAVPRDGGLFAMYEMANNHQGSVDHGIAIIRAMGEVSRQEGVPGGIKFQFRQLETFLHPGFLPGGNGNGNGNGGGPKPSSNKHTKRFLETRLNFEAYERMTDEARRAGLVPFATPFDEASVEWCERLDLPVIKIASCSASDWPLLKRIAAAGRPVVCSTAGLSLMQIDEVVEFFARRNVPLAIMHCVAVYPTPRNEVRLDRVRELRERYPDTVIGYSGHEGVQDLDVAGLAIAAGASLLERHVGVATDTIALNGYSLNPEQTAQWARTAAAAHATMGFGTAGASALEKSSLEELGRGIYLRKPKRAGEFLEREDFMLCMPCLPGQYAAGDLDEVIGLPVPHGGLSSMMPLMKTDHAALPPEIKVSSIVDRTRRMLNDARIALSSETTAEISHPYGLGEFEKQGAVIIDIVNREYCKKLIVQFPGQRHPFHKHIQKEETFQVLAGELDAEVNGGVTHLRSGDSLTVHRGSMHAFWTDTGMIMEEISTTHIKGDSIYEDESIPSDPTTRKTAVRL